MMAKTGQNTTLTGMEMVHRIGAAAQMKQIIYLIIITTIIMGFLKSLNSVKPGI